MELGWGGTAVVGEVTAARGAAALGSPVDVAAFGSGHGAVVAGGGSAVGLAISSSVAQRAARAKMSRVGNEGEAASEPSFSAREMSEMISSMVLVGAGDNHEPASSQVRFMPDRGGGTRIEAAVA